MSGQLIENILAALAEFYSANLGEEVKKGMRQKVRQGGWPHVPARGYRVIRDDLGHSRIEIDPVVGPIITRAFELVATQRIRPAALRGLFARLGLTQKNGRRLDKNAALKILRNPFYCGRLRWEGEIFAGRHPVLVSPETFDQVQAQLKKRPYEFRDRHLLSGLATCSACGALMTAEHHGRHTYYRCRNNLKSSDRCRAPFTNAVRAHADLQTFYRSVPVSADWWGRIRQRILETSRDEQSGLDEQRDGLLTELAFVERRPLRVADALATGVMDPEVYRLAVERLQLEEAALNKRLRALAGRVLQVPTVTLNETTTLWDLHHQLSPDQQRGLVRAVLTTVILDKSGIAYVGPEPSARAA